MVHWLTFVYATTDKQKRVQQWEFLATARQNWGDNWWLGGDFNDITGDRDKRGGTQRTTNSFNDFRLFISIMEMVECNFIGYAYTWNNLRRDADFVEERLDRVFVSPSWEMNYPNHQVLHIFMHASDHMLLMYKEEDGDQRSKDKSHMFNFDKRWTSKAGFSDCVEQAWSFTTSGKPLTQLSRKLKVCKENLKKWNNASKNNSALIIKDLSTQLENLHTKGGQRDWDNWGEIKQKLWEANRDEEVFWQQKSRLLWLKEGDKNTNFFHASTLQRRKRNSLFTLLDENGNVCANDDKISERVSDHFDNLFSTVWEGSDFGLLEGMPCTISAAQNTTIMKKVDEKEIKTALFELSPDKAPVLKTCGAHLVRSSRREMKNRHQNDLLRVWNGPFQFGTIVPDPSHASAKPRSSRGPSQDSERSFHIPFQNPLQNATFSSVPELERPFQVGTIVPDPARAPMPGQDRAAAKQGLGTAVPGSVPDFVPGYFSAL